MLKILVLTLAMLLMGCSTTNSFTPLSELQSTYELNYSTLDEYIQATKDPRLNRILKVAEPAGFQKIADVSVAPPHIAEDVYIYAIPTWKFGGANDEQIFFLEITQQDAKHEWYGPFLGKLIALVPSNIY